MNSLRMRLILSHMLPMLLILPLMGIALVYVLETQVVLANLSTSLRRQAGLLAAIAQDYPDIWQDQQAAQTFVERFQKPLIAQVMLIDPNGRLLASSDPADGSLVGQVLSLSGLENAQRGSVNVQVNHSQDLQADVADVLAPAFAGQQVVGVVRLTNILATVQERFWRLRSLILQVLAGALGLGIVMGLLLAVTLERPLVHLTRAMYQLISGEKLSSLGEQGPLEIRLLVRAFNTLIHRLQTLEQARQQLLANLTHELRRPLGALRSAVYALLHGASDDLKLRAELLTGVDAELRRLQYMLEDLSTLHEEALGQLKLRSQPVKLNEWLAPVLTPWRAEAQHKGLAWQETMLEPAPTLRIDADRLAQALGNLLSNAIKYTPAGGAVAVRTGVSDDSAWIAVSDTGPGLTGEEREQIFVPFYRSPSQQHVPHGMGLGLAIARDLVTAHDGQVEVESTPGAGSQFTIRLPLRFDPVRN